MTTQDRKTGWLTTSFHHHFREVLLHTLVRYNLACPIYCLMPDHLHILLVGISRGSDQLKGVQFFRKNLSARSPEPFRFQSQAYDSVLREENRALDAFPAVVAYIADNPVRKELVSVRSEYTFSASLFAGMPDLDWRRKDFWSVFWTAVNS